MFSKLRTAQIRRLLLLSLPLALLLCLSTPTTSMAYAILLRSDPTDGAVLKAGPAQIRMWFSENLNSAASTATIIDATGQNVDINGGLVLPINARELDVSLQPDLQPGVYRVIWHTLSSVDDNVFSGSFSFSIANADGSIPRTNGSLSNQSQLPGDTSTQLNGAALLRSLMVALLSLAVVLWLAGENWPIFMAGSSEAESSEQREIEQCAQQRFTRRFSLPLLRLLFLANIGVLLGQAVFLAGGRWDVALSPTLFIGILTSGSFGIYWLISEVIAGLAMALETYLLLIGQRGQGDRWQSWLKTLFSLLLLIATTLSITTLTTFTTSDTLHLLIEGLHLLAATLWLGSLFYICQVYLPTLAERTLPVQAQALLTILQRFSPIAIAGAIVLVLSGAFISISSSSFAGQGFASAHGYVVLVQAICIGIVLIISASLIFLYQPVLARTIKQYSTNEDHQQDNAERQSARVSKKLSEQHIARQVSKFTVLLYCACMPGIVIILCIGILYAL